MVQNTSNEIILTSSTTGPKTNKRRRLNKHTALSDIQEVHGDQWSPKTTNISVTGMNFFFTDKTCYCQNTQLKSHKEAESGVTLPVTHAALSCHSRLVGKLYEGAQ